MNDSHHPRPTNDSDEISLRELYLILKRGLPLILGVAVIAGVLAFLVSSFRPPVYQAESTTLIAPPPISIQGTGGLTLSPGTDVSFETYETLALSQPVLEAAVADFAARGWSAEALRGAGGLEKLLGPERPDQEVPLSVTHSVRANDPELAAALADSWARATLETVRNSLLANLAPVDTATTGELDALRARLSEAEAALEAFRRRDNTAVLEARAASLAGAIADARAGRVELTELTALPGADLLNAPTVNLEQEIAANEALLQSLQDAGGTAEVEAQIVFRQALLESLRARRALLEEQVAAYQQAYREIQIELAGLTRERSELERELENAQAAYQDVVRLQPTISYVTELAPAAARMLNEASVPTEPVGPRRLLNTALAVVLGGMLALLFVFLREAVSAKSDHQTQTADRAYVSAPSTSKG